MDLSQYNRYVLSRKFFLVLVVPVITFKSGPDNRPFGPLFPYVYIYQSFTLFPLICMEKKKLYAEVLKQCYNLKNVHPGAKMACMNAQSNHLPSPLSPNKQDTRHPHQPTFILYPKVIHPSSQRAKHLHTSSSLFLILIKIP